MTGRLKCIRKVRVIPKRVHSKKGFKTPTRIFAGLRRLLLNHLSSIWQKFRFLFYGFKFLIHHQNRGWTENFKLWTVGLRGISILLLIPAFQWKTCRSCCLSSGEQFLRSCLSLKWVLIVILQGCHFALIASGWLIHAWKNSIEQLIDSCLKELDRIVQECPNVSISVPTLENGAGKNSNREIFHSFITTSTYL